MSIQETLELRNVCCRTGVERKMSDLMDVSRGERRRCTARIGTGAENAGNSIIA
jgi:hypothetical protein